MSTENAEKITEAQVEDLAGLARMEVSEGELEKLASDMDEILAYVGEVSGVAGEVGAAASGGEEALRNVFRADEFSHKPGEYTADILANAPETEGKYIKVKKIL